MQQTFQIIIKCRDRSTLSRMDRLEATRETMMEDDRDLKMILQNILEGTSSSLGGNFLRSLVKHLASSLKMKYAFIASCQPDLPEASTMAIWMGSDFGKNFKYDLTNTPCQIMIDRNEEGYYEEGVKNHFSGESSINYLGTILRDSKKRQIGHLVVLDPQPLPPRILKRNREILQIFAQRAEVELERMEMEVGQTKLLTELDQKNRDLTKLNNEKDEIIHVVSHDLRTPLSQILGVVNLLKVCEDSRDASEYIDWIKDSTEHMMNMVNKILDLESIGSSNLSIQDIELDELILKITEQFNVRLRDKDITVKSEVLPSARLSTDKTYLLQILENLLSNAAKFSPAHSTIFMNVSDNQGFIRIEIVDNGPGIRKDEQDKLFKKFQRLSAVPTAGERSTGLGLAIVKRFTEMLGGKIGVESSYGNGATFWVELPKEGEATA